MISNISDIKHSFYINLESRPDRKKHVEEQLKIIGIQAERFNALGFNKFKGWTCNSGFQSVIIRGNEVKRSYSCHDVPLGTLEHFELFKEPRLCITPSCVSSADSKIPKCR